MRDNPKTRHNEKNVHHFHKNEEKKSSLLILKEKKLSTRSDRYIYYISLNSEYFAYNFISGEKEVPSRSNGGI